MVDLDFETPTLRAIAQAFNARRKALKHKTRSYSVMRKIESGSAESAEEVLLIELSVVDLAGKLPSLHVKVWPDRWVSGVAYQRGNTGENWTSDFDGRISAKVTPIKFEKDVENFLDGMCIGSYRSAEDASAYWQHKLVRGPTGLVRQK